MTLLPEGFGLDLDRSVRSFRKGTVLAGGHPGRLLTLSDAGVGALAALVAGKPVTESARRLGGRLVDAGMAHPRWDGNTAHPRWEGRVTVVVPTRDRSESLDRCLASLGGAVPVLVVDDGSERTDRVASVCGKHGATVITRPANGGPAAARNDALAAVTTEYIAFVDSDCTVTEGWLDPLMRLFLDPAVGAVAPRVRPERSMASDAASALDRYSDARSALDMGSDPSEVGPGRQVRYVPTAALVVRRAAVVDGFDQDLRVGEDVDLVWRLLSDGWRARFEPSVTVRHREPSSWRALLARRFRYGTSAGPLAARHPGRLAPVELRPWPTAAVAALLLRRPRTAAVAVLASSAQLASTLNAKGIPFRRSLLWSTEAVGWTWVGIGRAATMLATPLVALSGLRSRKAATTIALLVLAPPALEWWRKRPGLDPLRWAAASIADDVAYGAGVWAGCVSSRSFGPLLPEFRRSTASPGASWVRPVPGATPDATHLV